MTSSHLNAYVHHPHEAGGHRVSLVERARLCLLFDELGPSAPTWSGDWDTHHLAAHLRVREGNPLRQVQTALPGRAASAIESRVRQGDFDALVAEVRGGPPRLTVYGAAKTDKLLNTLEFFVHHEDVRRAQPTWQSRQLPQWAQDQIWDRIQSFAKLIMRKSPVGVVLAPCDRADAALAVRGTAPAVVRGLPSELTLFAFGRNEVADVELTGPAESVAQLRATDFSV
ncbi:MAG: TIGR03085 family metal-binding protein [Actinomycetota bacterium]|nr:TIGR03085 family metal-binding protein [Actinomycetota bacterium]